MICTETTMLGFTIVWLFGIACGLLVSVIVAWLGWFLTK